MSTKTDTPVQSGPITLLGWILSYPHLTEAHIPPGGTTPRFGAELRLPKDHPNFDVEFAKVNGPVQAIKKDKETDKKVKIFPSGIAALKDGDDPAWEKRKEEHAGHWVMSANRAEKQGPPDAYGKKASAGVLSIAETNKLFYPGCIVNAKVGIYYTKNGGDHKIPASLELIQFAGDGERLAGGGGKADPSDLPDIDEEPADLPAGM